MLQSDFDNFLQIHQEQLLSSAVPQHFWQTLFVKLKNQIFDSNDTFNLLKIDYDGTERSEEDPLFVVQIKCDEGIKCNDSKQIYLVDHAWTFRLDFAKQQLLQMSNLLDRMCSIMGIEGDDLNDRVSKVCKNMWKFCQTYSVANASSVEERLPIWYIMDELGCAIQHSDEPNFRTVPFVYVPEQITYTLIFPVKDLEVEDQVTRDFAEGITDEMQRKCLLFPWIKTDFTNLDYTQTEPDENYFLSGHIKESLPFQTQFEVIMPQKIKVYSEYSMVNQFLTHNRFELVEDENSADILWYTRHFKKYLELSKNPNRFVNQFPFENVLTIKDLLSIVCRRNSQNPNVETLETYPNWLPTTYNLKTELPKFISYFQNRNNLNLDNHWICKPWNLARSLDTHITNNLDYIVRLSTTGPKIAQKYIENPVLFYRPECGKVKFDIRYVILLKSATPLCVYTYNNFFLRFANKPYELNNFEEYEKHFTVMNYNEAVLHHLPCADFLKEWEQQYPHYPWSEIEVKIREMLKGCFVGATCEESPKGIAPNPQSRAVYAADIMLSWESATMQPKLLEINWTPDCKRACDYYPDFYNDIFSCLFLNDESCNSFTCL